MAMLAILVTDFGQSMAVNGFDQAEYDRLILEVRVSAHHVRPKTFTTLPIHGSKRPRETGATNSGSEIDDVDSFAAPEVLVKH